MRFSISTHTFAVTTIISGRLIKEQRKDAFLSDSKVYNALGNAGVVAEKAQEKSL